MNNQKFIVRTNEAGVFFGEIKERTHDEITMLNVRKLWYWRGACAVEPQPERMSIRTIIILCSVLIFFRI